MPSRRPAQSNDETVLIRHPRQRSLRSVAGLIESGHLKTAGNSELQQVADQFAVAITPTMLDLAEAGNPDDPVGRQFLPNERELVGSADDRTDPIGDKAHSPVKGIVHRYPDRVLLTPLHVCPVYCRFCFRREQVGQPEAAALSNTELTAALDYIRGHTDIWEVILSGGDPLLLSPHKLQLIISELNGIEHVKVIRIHTRIPLVDPGRISHPLIDAIKQDKPVFVVLHSNHPQEFSAAGRQACAALVDNGIPMLSQTVLLKGVNDAADTLESLFRTLVENRIKPYYLHHADKASGTAHFRTSLAEGQALTRELRGRVSGLCQPHYILDIPGGAGKVPASDSWIQEDSSGRYTVTAPDGTRHQYTDTD